jgi:hypothetical protein
LTVDNGEANEKHVGIGIRKPANPVPFVVVPGVSESQAVGPAINTDIHCAVVKYLEIGVA